MHGVSRIFRVLLEVGDLDKAVDFYSKLLDATGRKVGGSRAYFDCGGVILALLDPTPGGKQSSPNTGDLYFSVANVEEVHARALALGCLSIEIFHDQNGGEVVTRPWGERSFYAEDPWGNGLCFVDEKTLFTGR